MNKKSRLRRTRTGIDIEKQITTYLCRIHFFAYNLKKFQKRSSGKKPTLPTIQSGVGLDNEAFEMGEDFGLPQPLKINTIPSFNDCDMPEMTSGFCPLAHAASDNGPFNIKFRLLIH